MGPSVQPLHRAMLGAAPTETREPSLGPTVRALPGVESAGPRISGATQAATLTHHRRAPQNLRHRVTTAVLHFGALVAADLVAFAVVIAVFLGLRDQLWLGAQLSEAVRALVPS